MKWLLFFLGVSLTFSTKAIPENQMLDELEAIDVNGSKQWLLERGTDKTKPVVLFVHGGPGSPLMYFSRAFDNAFMNDFVIVHWDQRGSGKSFNPKEPSTNYEFNRYVDDGLAVAKQLKIKFQKEKILLVGHSWGTMVAFNMVAKQPSLFQSLVTVGTVSDMGKMEEFRYQRVFSEIEKANNAMLDFEERLKEGEIVL